MKPDHLKIIFGACFLIIVAALTASIALGHVEEKTSYGLMPLLMLLASIWKDYAQWAFGKRDKDD